MILNSFERIIKSYFDSDLVQGVVVDNNDPIQKSRVKVSLDGMTNSIAVDDLPWYPPLLHSANSKADIPQIGTRVTVLFIDIYNSVVIGSIPSITPIG